MQLSPLLTVGLKTDLDRLLLLKKPHYLVVFFKFLVVGNQLIEPQFCRNNLVEGILCCLAIMAWIDAESETRRPSS